MVLKEWQGRCDRNHGNGTALQEGEVENGESKTEEGTLATGTA
jgi:hypothetical protein